MCVNFIVIIVACFGKVALSEKNQLVLTQRVPI
jgi:hypothetical protein